jgi:hypothetical protein
VNATVTRLRRGARPRLIDGQEALFAPAMCDPCRDEWLRWLDYRTPRPVQIVNHATYDATPAGVASNRKAAAGRTAETIRFQQALIRRLCAEGSHVSARPQEMDA